MRINIFIQLQDKNHRLFVPTTLFAFLCQRIMTTEVEEIQAAFVGYNKDL